MAQVVPALEGPMPTCVDLNSVEDHVKKRMGGFLILGAAIDGSNMSDRAMQVALSFHNQKRGDKLKIIHVSDRTKNYLQRHLQPTHLRHYYEDLAGASRVQADWICREKEEGKTTCETLTGLADKNGIDILVVGSFGRKGEKLDLLGTVSDFSLRQAHSSICIVRSTSSKWDRQCKFLFSTDGSQAAALAFSILVTHLRKLQDRVDVVFVTTKDEVDEAANVKHYQEYMAKHKVIGDCTVKCIDRLTQRVPDGILEASLERDCDVLVLGISGYGKKKLGSVSETISMRATCTTLIIKDSRELFGNRYLGAASIMADITPNGSAGSSSRKTLAA